MSKTTNGSKPTSTSLPSDAQVAPPHIPDPVDIGLPEPIDVPQPPKVIPPTAEFLAGVRESIERDRQREATTAKAAATAQQTREQMMAEGGLTLAAMAAFEKTYGEVKPETILEVPCDRDQFVHWPWNERRGGPGLRVRADDPFLAWKLPSGFDASMRSQFRISPDQSSPCSPYTPRAHGEAQKIGYRFGASPVYAAGPSVTPPMRTPNAPIPTLVRPQPSLSDVDAAVPAEVV